MAHAAPDGTPWRPVPAGVANWSHLRVEKMFAQGELSGEEELPFVQVSYQRADGSKVVFPDLIPLACLVTYDMYCARPMQQSVLESILERCKPTLMAGQIVQEQTFILRVDGKELVFPRRDEKKLEAWAPTSSPSGVNLDSFAEFACLVPAVNGKGQLVSFFLYESKLKRCIDMRYALTVDATTQCVAVVAKPLLRFFNTPDNFLPGFVVQYNARTHPPLTNCLPCRLPDVTPRPLSAAFWRLPSGNPVTFRGGAHIAPSNWLFYRGALQAPQVSRVPTAECAGDLHASLLARMQPTASAATQQTTGTSGAVASLIEAGPTPSHSSAVSGLAATSTLSAASRGGSGGGAAVSNGKRPRSPPHVSAAATSGEASKTASATVGSSGEGGDVSEVRPGGSTADALERSVRARLDDCLTRLLGGLDDMLAQAAQIVRTQTTVAESVRTQTAASGVAESARQQTTVSGVGASASTSSTAVHEVSTGPGTWATARVSQGSTQAPQPHSKHPQLKWPHHGSPPRLQVKPAAAGAGGSGSSNKPKPSKGNPSPSSGPILCYAARNPDKVWNNNWCIRCGSTTHTTSACTNKAPVPKYLMPGQTWNEGKPRLGVPIFAPKNK